MSLKKKLFSSVLLVGVILTIVGYQVEKEHAYFTLGYDEKQESLDVFFKEYVEILDQVYAQEDNVSEVETKYYNNQTSLYMFHAAARKTVKIQLKSIERLENLELPNLPEDEKRLVEKMVNTTSEIFDENLFAWQQYAMYLDSDHDGYYDLANQAWREIDVLHEEFESELLPEIEALLEKYDIFPEENDESIYSL